MLFIPVIAKAGFSIAHTSVFTVKWSFRNHSNMLILVLKKFILIINVENSWVNHFRTFFLNRKFKRTAFLWNRNVCIILNVFTGTFDQVNASLLNTNINFFKKVLLTPNSWMVVYSKTAHLLLKAKSMKLMNWTSSEQQSLLRNSVICEQYYHLAPKYIILMSHSLKYIQVQSVLSV